MSKVIKEQDADFRFKSPIEEKAVIPDQPPKCPWTKDLHKTEKSPHSKWDWKPYPAKVLPNIAKAVGNTPMVKLNGIPKAENLECEIYGKCEFLNPVGSIKDRMLIRCIEDAERSGILKPGATIIECTSGNTGVALAWASSIKGYKCVIVLPDKFSMEKELLIKAFGGEVVRVPMGVPYTGENGMYGKAHALHKQIPNSIILDQFSNPSNPLAHYDTTAEEIYYQCDGQVDMIVMGCGTGGTMSGISRKFKEISPNTIIIGADPYGSQYAQPCELNKTDVKAFDIEGIGYEYTPTVCDRSMVSKWYKFHDKVSLNMCRRLIREEGLLVGTSSGVLMAGALQAIKDFKMGKGKKVVVLLPDGAKNYLTKFICDQWMEQRNLLPAVNTRNHWWWDVNVMELSFKPCQTVEKSASPKDVLALMDKLNVDYLPAVNDGLIVGLATRKNTLNRLIAEESPNDEINNCLVRMFSKLPKASSLGLASRVLEVENYVVILDSDSGNDVALGVVTSDDILHYIQTHKKH
ncbi:unnamed protein product [Diabrotica balteata]|uniref:cystathionine beta-synthase n=1 Tax=Diabrotica balteata TaxID=107213 RepID=A0A9N9T3Y5_DIABA|nr:unnamed protein product [Diabrotica balteata]